MEPVAQALSAIIALVAMTAILITVPLLPFVPGPALMWVVVAVYAVIDRQATVGWPVLIVETLLMILGSTSNIWVQVLGVKAGGGGCLSAITSLIGGLVGLILFPPFGGLIGAVVAAFGTELVIHKDWRKALTAGTGTFGGWVLTVVIEFLFSLAMLILFLVALFV